MWRGIAYTFYSGLYTSATSQYREGQGSALTFIFMCILCQFIKLWLLLDCVLPIVPLQ